MIRLPVLQQALLAALLAVVAATVGLPPPGGAHLAPAPALALGAGAGLVLFRVLAGGLPRHRPRPLRPARLVGGLAAIATQAACEEVAWRGYLLALLSPVATPVGALAASSVLFSLAHADARGRRRLVHLATGAAFGGVYLATGRLAAAVLAHTVYNAAVALGLAPDACAGPPRPALAPAAVRLARARPPTPAADGGSPACLGAPPPAEALAVVKRFGARVALAGVDLRLERGEVLALLGRNGAGKTTLVSLLLGLRRPDEGTVRLFGADPGLPAARRRVAAVLQEPAFPSTLRISELVALVAAHFADPLPLPGTLDRFGLTELAHRQAGGLSTGERRRLAAALAFVGRPGAVFLDEPTAGLDVDARRRLWEVIRDHAAAGGSVLLTTHHLEEAEALATRVAVISRGVVVARGTVPELRRRAGLSRVRLRATRLPSLRGAVRVEPAGDGTTIHTRDVEALLGELRGGGVPLDGLEITPLSLEETFLELVDPEAERP